MLKKICELDEKTCKFLSQFSNNPVLGVFAYTGNIIIISIVLLILTLVPATAKTGIISIAALAIATLFVFTLKYSVKRRRSVAGSRFTAKFDPYSFPSGHASRLAVFIITPVNPAASIILLFISVIASSARIAKGYHALSDCAAGILIGVMSGIAALLLNEFYVDKVLMLVKYVTGFVFQ